MRRHEKRVVITGLGLISPIGIGLEAYWASLSAGRGGVRPIEAFTIEGLPNRIGGEVRGFDPRALTIPKHKKALVKSLKYMARDIQLAVAAAELAIQDAGLVDGGVDPARFGLDLGAGLISTELDELAPAILASSRTGSFDYQEWGKEGIPLIPPIWLLKYLPNMLACHISIFNDCQGPSNTVTEGEAASNLAIAEASRLIGRGRADVMVSGGADSKIHPLSVIRMALLNQMTRWDGPPEHACRPFDRRRDGTVPGEGSGILILEELEHARRRGVKIYGEILGAGSGADANPGGGLDPEGIGCEIAMRSALRDAEIEPSEVGHINAHGVGSVIGDLAEARAIQRVFGSRIPVTSLKGAMGNLVSGSGAVELVGSLLGVNRGLIPATLNCDELDPAIELDLVRGTPRATSNPVFLSVNMTRHGQAAAVIVRGYPENG